MQGRREYGGDCIDWRGGNHAALKILLWMAVAVLQTENYKRAGDVHALIAFFQRFLTSHTDTQHDVLWPYLPYVLKRHKGATMEQQ